MSGIALLGILTVLFGMGIYVSVAMGLGGLALVTIFGDRPVWDIFGYVPWNTTTSFTLVALPLFVLMGEVLLRSGVTEGMYSTLAKWLNPLPGGLLHSNIAACAMFAPTRTSNTCSGNELSAVGPSSPILRTPMDTTSLRGPRAVGVTLGQSRGDSRRDLQRRAPRAARGEPGRGPGGGRGIERRALAGGAAAR